MFDKKLEPLRAKGCNFFPRLSATNERIGLKLGEEDFAKASGRGNVDSRGVVTNMLTNKQYNIKGAACDLPNCKCDAVATPLEAKT